MWHYLKNIICSEKIHVGNIKYEESLYQKAYDSINVQIKYQNKA